MSGLAQKTMLISAILIIQIVITVYATAAILNIKYGDKLMPGIEVGGMPVGGLATRDAQALIQDSLPQFINIVLPDGSAEQIYFEQAGVSFDLETSINQAYALGRPSANPVHTAENLVFFLKRSSVPLQITVNEELLLENIASALARHHREPINARIEKKEYSINIIPDSPGLTTDPSAIMAQLLKQIDKGQFEPLPAVTRVIEPLLTIETLEQFKQLHATFSTELVDMPKRTHNIGIASKQLDHYILKPAEEFSFNNTIGPRLAESGYLTAQVIVNNRYILDYGGGICQLASTLYNAVLMANLEVLERNPHSLPTAYVPRGRDAAVAWNLLDLKFRNNHDYPVLITSGIDKKTLTVNIFATTSPDYIEMDLSRMLSVVPPEFAISPEVKGQSVAAMIEKYGSGSYCKWQYLPNKYYDLEKKMMVFAFATAAK